MCQGSRPIRRLEGYSWSLFVHDWRRNIQQSGRPRPPAEENRQAHVIGSTCHGKKPVD